MSELSPDSLPWMENEELVVGRSFSIPEITCTFWLNCMRLNKAWSGKPLCLSEKTPLLNGLVSFLELVFYCVKITSSSSMGFILSSSSSAIRSGPLQSANCSTISWTREGQSNRLCSSLFSYEEEPSSTQITISMLGANRLTSGNGAD